MGNCNKKINTNIIHIDRDVDISILRKIIIIIQDYIMSNLEKGFIIPIEEISLNTYIKILIKDKPIYIDDEIYYYILNQKLFEEIIGGMFFEIVVNYNLTHDEKITVYNINWEFMEIIFSN